MKTSIEHVGNILAAVIWADGEYAESEHETVDEIAENFGFNTMMFNKIVDGGVGGMNNKDEATVNKILNESAKAVVASERLTVYEGCVELILCDSVVSRSECDKLIAIAEALEIDSLTAAKLYVGMIADPNKGEQISEADLKKAVEGSKDLVGTYMELAEKLLDKEMFVIEND